EGWTAPSSVRWPCPRHRSWRPDRSPVSCFHIYIYNQKGSTAAGAKMLAQRLDGEGIAMRPEPGDNAERDLRDIGQVPEFLAPVNIGQVHFGNGQADTGQGVHQRDGSMGQPGRVQHDAGMAAPRFMDPVDQHALVIRLAEINTA